MQFNHTRYHCTLVLKVQQKQMNEGEESYWDEETAHVISLSGY